MPCDRAAAARGGTVQEISGQRKNVVGALAQRRYAERHHVQPMVEVLAETAALHLRRQVAIGRRHQAHIELPGARAADPLELALLQHAEEFGLERGGELANLVQKDGAALGHLELALLLRHRARERALLVPE